jgi:hypothetical protein
MAIKFTNSFYCKTLQNFPKLGFFGLKIYHLATLVLNGSKLLKPHLPRTGSMNKSTTNPPISNCRFRKRKTPSWNSPNYSKLLAGILQIFANSETGFYKSYQIVIVSVSSSNGINLNFLNDPKMLIYKHWICDNRYDKISYIFRTNVQISLNWGLPKLWYFRWNFKFLWKKMTFVNFCIQWTPFVTTKCGHFIPKLFFRLLGTNTLFSRIFNWSFFFIDSSMRIFEVKKCFCFRRISSFRNPNPSSTKTM